MNFLSLPFLCFFPVTALLYFLLPRRLKNGWLLLASWFFYLCAQPVYLSLLLFVILTSYGAGLALERRRSKGMLALFLAGAIILLFLFKYVNFALLLVSQVLGGLGIAWQAPALTLVLPVGLSFYLFQAMGYVLDVWRGKVRAQRSFLIHALFLSFFPQVVSGPIGRADELVPQFLRPNPFDYDRFRRGLIRFLWGAFLKVVLADRLAVLVNTVFGAPESYGFVQLIGAAVAFAFQIYCDFSAYTHMALGVADSMGFTLRENFRTPYFARSVAEFWRRWHMSLTSWFRDYLYIPLGGSRCGTARKYLNILIVFTLSGLWHGSALTFVVWGLLNGLYQVVGQMTAPLRDRCWARTGIQPDGALRHGVQTVITFLLIAVTWVFFKASSMSNAWAVLSGMCRGPAWVGLSMGLDRWELLIAAGGLLLLLLVDLLSRKRDLTADYLELPRLVRWCVLWVLLFGCLVFGSYGAGYDPQDFLYGFSF